MAFLFDEAFFSVNVNLLIVLEDYVYSHKSYHAASIRLIVLYYCGTPECGHLEIGYQDTLFCPSAIQAMYYITPEIKDTSLIRKLFGVPLVYGFFGTSLYWRNRKCNGDVMYDLAEYPMVDTTLNYPKILFSLIITAALAMDVHFHIRTYIPEISSVFS